VVLHRLNVSRLDEGVLTSVFSSVVSGSLAGKSCPRPSCATSSSEFTHTHTHTHILNTMADQDVNLYDEVEIEDCFYDETLQIYHHPCPCGDRFEICIADMRDGEDIARCPSCSLMIRIIFDQVGRCTANKVAALSTQYSLTHAPQSDLPPDNDNAPQASAITA
jgi:diphthamide biosynthesis protein 3